MSLTAYAQPTPQLVMGVRQPRVYVPALQAVRSAGSQAIALARHAGLYLDDWQQDAVREGLGVRADGLCAAQNVGLVVGRQNGKGSILEAVELYWLFVAGVQEITHTSHEFKTTRKHHLRLWSLIENTPDLLAAVKNHLTSNAEMSIELHVPGCWATGAEASGCCSGGAKITFLARSKTSGRGLQGEKIVLDEAFALTSPIMAALIPAQSAQRDPQAWFVSTPPPPGPLGETFCGLHDLATAWLEDKTGALAQPVDWLWLEWSAPEGADPRDWASIAQANPALGGRLRHDVVTREAPLIGGYDSVEYGTERMCQWPVSRHSRPLDGDRWDELGEEVDPERPEDAPQISGAYAVAIVATDDTLAKLYAVVAGDRADGYVQVEIAREFRGVRAVIPWLQRRAEEDDTQLCAIVIDSKNPAAALIDAAEAAGLEILSPTGGEYAAACVSFANAVNDDMEPVYDDDGQEIPTPSIRHLGDERLAIAVHAAGKRRIGALWGWRGDGVAPVEGATLAVFGLVRNRPDDEGGVILW